MRGGGSRDNHGEERSRLRRHQGKIFNRHHGGGEKDVGTGARCIRRMGVNLCAEDGYLEPGNVQVDRFPQRSVAVWGSGVWRGCGEEERGWGLGRRGKRRQKPLGPDSRQDLVGQY